MADIYDEAVEYFTKNPGKIGDAWTTPSHSRYGFLFAFMDETRKGCSYSNGVLVVAGCPSQIKSGRAEAQTEELTKFIIDQPDLHPDFNVLQPDAQIKCLNAFAIVQRKADELLKRKIPTTP